MTSPGIVRAAEPAAPSPAKFEPTVESLRQAEVPEWFIDGKLGIFMHWGPESIPGVASTSYARWMYEQGSEGYKYHCATYGHPSTFGYEGPSKFEVEHCPGKHGQGVTCPIYLTGKERRGKSTATVVRQIRLNPAEFAELSKKLSFK